jgi:hypothetical protein
MKILELATSGFKIPDATYSLRDKDGPAGAVVVTGAPGSGKTLFLRLVAGVKEVFAPYGSAPDLRPFLRPGARAGRLAAAFALTEDEARRAGWKERELRVVVDVDPSGAVASIASAAAAPAAAAVAPVAAAPDMAALKALFAPSGGAAPASRWELFPAHRRLQTADWDVAHPPLSAAIEDGRRLAPDGAKYVVLRRVLHDLLLAQATSVASALDAQGVALRGLTPDPFAAHKAGVAAMLPDLRLLSLELRAGSAVPVFLRRGGERVRMAELTASEEQGVLFGLAYAWLGLSGAVVLVDSPELHVATEEQSAFFGRLLALGKDNQTIAATGSASIAARAGACVVDLGKGAGARS